MNEGAPAAGAAGAGAGPATNMTVRATSVVSNPHSSQQL